MLSVRARAFRALVRRGADSARNLSLDQRREQMDRLGAMARLPKGTRVSPVDAPGLSGEWVRVPHSRADRVILYLHGGAFCMGSPASHRNLVAWLCASAGARALSLDYPLAPEHPFPAALDHTIAAYRFLRTTGVAPDRIAFGGDSAGANLVLAALLMLRDAGEPLPAAAACISPPTDLTGGSPSLVSRAHLDPMVRLESVGPLCRAYAGGTRADDPRLSPLAADLKGLPPLLIHVGSNEILFDDSLRFARKAREAGVDVRLEVGEELWHVWHAAVPYVPESTRAVQRIGRFLSDLIPPGDSPCQGCGRADPTASREDGAGRGRQGGGES
jgi:epsilon-lactone hydrolase